MDHKISNEELIEELKSRFDGQKRALAEVQELMQELTVLNQRLENSEKLKTHFLSNIRNEIINPFASIMGFARQLTAGKQLSQASIANIGRMIHNEAFSLDFQLQNIFMAAELEAGEVIPEISAFDPVQFIEKALINFKDKASQKSTKLNFKNDWPANEMFVGDAPKIGVCLNNLLSNALKFNEKDSEVTVHLSGQTDGMMVSVMDFGHGIEPKNVARVFDRFVQLDEGMMKESPGHGLGLSITKALVDYMDGHLDIDTQKGKGSTFTILIPMNNETQKGYATDANEVFFSDEMIF